MNKKMKPKVKFFYIGWVLVFSFIFVFVQKARAISMESITSQGGAYSTGSLVNDKGTIYFIRGSEKVPFTNYQSFLGLGYSLKNAAKGDLSAYTLPASGFISSSAQPHPVGSWVRVRGTIYYLSEMGPIGIPSEGVFFSNGGKWSSVVAANKYDLAAISGNTSQFPLQNNDARVAGFIPKSDGNTNPNSSSPNLQTTPGNTTVYPNATTTDISYPPELTVPNKIYTNAPFTVGARSTSPTNSPLYFSYDWGDGTPPTSMTFNSASHSYAVSGQFTLKVDVTDGRSKIGSTSTLLTVVDPVAYPPVLSLPSSVVVNTPFTVSAVSSDPFTPLTYTYYWGDDSPNDSVITTSATHAYSKTGSYTITVKVVDSKSFSYVSSVAISVVSPANPKPSVPQISAPATGIVGTPVTVSANSSDPNGLTVTYSFLWDDGTSEYLTNSNSANHTYLSARNYSVVVSAISDGGRSSNIAVIQITAN